MAEATTTKAPKENATERSPAGNRVVAQLLQPGDEETKAANAAQNAPPGAAPAKTP